jgi:hypothetical protein
VHGHSRSQRLSGRATGRAPSCPPTRSPVQVHHRRMPPRSNAQNPARAGVGGLGFSHAIPRLIRTRPARAQHCFCSSNNLRASASNGSARGAGAPCSSAPISSCGRFLDSGWASLIAARPPMTALSVAVACSMPAWAALCAEGIRKLVLPPAASHVTLCADHASQPAGSASSVRPWRSRRAAGMCSAPPPARGRRARRVPPSPAAVRRN